MYMIRSWVSSCSVLLHLLVEQATSNNSLLLLRSTKMDVIESWITSCSLLLLWESYEQQLLSYFVSSKMHIMIVEWHPVEIFFLYFLSFLVVFRMCSTAALTSSASTAFLSQNEAWWPMANDNDNFSLNLQSSFIAFDRERRCEDRKDFSCTNG